MLLIMYKRVLSKIMRYEVICNIFCDGAFSYGIGKILNPIYVLRLNSS